VSRRLLIIVNPAAGANRALAGWKATARVLQGHGLDFDEFVTGRPGDAMRAAAEGAHRYPAIVAAGGDGTVLEVLNGILGKEGRNTALGFLPLGTGNDTAHAFGVGTVADAVRGLRRGREHIADVLRVRCTSGQTSAESFALSFAGAGIVTDLLKRTGRNSKRLLGRRLVYHLALVRSILAYQAPAMTVWCDGQEHRGRFLFVCASNSETAGGGMRIAPGAKTDDGLAQVNLVRAAGRAEVLRHLWRLSRGRHITHPKVRFFAAREMEITTEEPADVAADGDLIGHTPAKVEVRPRALRVICGWP
jgi:diacylglycerol kinase (ATP)